MVVASASGYAAMENEAACIADQAASFSKQTLMADFEVTIEAPEERPQEVNAVPKQLAIALGDELRSLSEQSVAVSRRIALIRRMLKRLEQLLEPGEQ